MNRRILVIEPDLAVRRMVERALTSGGFAPTSVPTIEASRAVLDAKPIEAVVVELRATNAEGAEGVRALRRDYPELPLVVTSTLLTTSLMQELVRVRVDDILPKPFTPRELVTVVQRVLREVKTRGDGAMEYASAMAAARRAIVEGRLGDTEAPLERARAVSPLDSESMALFSLVRELSGDDRGASRGYRGALGLQEERVTDDALPREGLARLSAYRGARPTPALDHEHRRVLWVIGDPLSELPMGAPDGATPDVVVFSLGLVANEVGATYARQGADAPAFLVTTSALTDRLALRIARTFHQPIILAHPKTLARIGSVAEEGAFDADSRQT